MKIYKHTFSEFRNVIETVEIEVEEKPKTYVVVDKQRSVYQSRINKDDIDKLGINWSKTMFTLSPDRKAYINSLITAKEYEIKRLKNKIEKAEQRKNTLVELLKKEDEEK